jgi:thioredoxin-related protein
VYVTRKLAFAVVLFASALVAIGANAHAAELVMFERPGCPWCKRWHTEIGPAYPLTTEGKAASLRRHHIRDQALAGITLSRPVTVTPTFVLAEGGREVGRIVGYPGEDFFYEMLDGLLKDTQK